MILVLVFETLNILIFSAGKKKRFQLFLSLSCGSCPTSYISNYWKIFIYTYWFSSWGTIASTHYAHFMFWTN